MHRLLLPCALFLCGCPENLEKQSEIVKLRVLAVQAEPAELIVDPAQPLPRATLTALAVEPPPTIDCPGTQGIPLPPSGPVSATLDLADPQVISLALQHSQDADAGAALAQGIPVLLGFRATAPAHGLPDGGPPGNGGGDLQVLQGLTTVTVRSPGAPPNGNPSIAALQMGGAEISPDGGTAVPAGTVQRLTPVPDPDSKEPAGGGVEPLGYSFFATVGSISSLRSADITATGQPADTFVDWTAPDTAPEARLWVVVRDGRGGVGWIARSVQIIRPAAR
jgi:hypothetical protein